MAQHHTLLRALMACLLASVLVTFAPAPPPAVASARLDACERSVVKRLNRIRARHGLPRLRVDRRLSRSADYHSADMLSADFFAHPSSNGDSMAERVKAYRPARLLGEVLAYVPGTRKRGAARKVVRLWMSSEGHRASVLTPGYTRVGLARRAGKLGSARASVFTADFASRR